MPDELSKIPEINLYDLIRSYKLDPVLTSSSQWCVNYCLLSVMLHLKKLFRFFRAVSSPSMTSSY